MAYVALHDRLVLGISSAVSVGVLVGAVSLPLFLEQTLRVGVPIVWVLLVAVSKVTSSEVPSAPATAAIAAAAAACCSAFVADSLPALPSHVAVLAAITALAVKLFATSRPIVYNYIGRFLPVSQTCHDGFITADYFDSNVM